MKKHVLTPLRRKHWEILCGFRGQQKKTNKWVLNKAGVKRELSDTVKARKLAYYCHTMRKQGSCLEKGIMQGSMPGAQRRGRPRTAWMDNIKTWTRLSVEESVRTTDDRDKWRKYVHGVANARIEDGWRTEQMHPLRSYEGRCKMQKMGWFAVVRGHSRSWAMSPFDRADTSFYLTL